MAIGLSRLAGHYVPEAVFMADVIEYAEEHGWRTYHTHDSRRSTPGFPDLVMTRHGRLVIAELKAQDGRLRREQREWLGDLSQVEGIEVKLYRPSDWPAIEELLK